MLPITDYEQHLKEVKRFLQLVESSWQYAIGSLTLKDLNEKNSTIPQALPITADIKLFKNNYTQNKAEERISRLKNDYKDVNAFKNVTDAALAFSILLNRKRVGDVQYTKLKGYNLNINTTDQEECLKTLTDSERAISGNFKRLVTIGKGSKAVPMLFAKNLQNYIDTMISVRNRRDSVPQENSFLFAQIGSPDKWGDGSVVLRKYVADCGAKHPHTLTSSRLRKQIATVLDILHLNSTEMEQIAAFMGHTKKKT